MGSKYHCCHTSEAKLVGFFWARSRFARLLRFGEGDLIEWVGERIFMGLLSLGIWRHGDGSDGLFSIRLRA